METKRKTKKNYKITKVIIAKYISHIMILMLILLKCMIARMLTTINTFIKNTLSEITEKNNIEVKMLL